MEVAVRTDFIAMLQLCTPGIRTNPEPNGTSDRQPVSVSSRGDTGPTFGHGCAGIRRGHDHSQFTNPFASVSVANNNAPCIH
mmetsp:Transcript_17370/g.21333  ORF Transcript_17370/g.21333 Transcript_17370/m.21333 type:complete len:82 (-) Transcript_17370:426-671(-)